MLLRHGGEVLGADAVLGFEGAIEIGIVSEAAVLIDLGGGLALREQVLGNDEPLLNDIAVDAGAHNAVEFVGQMVLVDKEMICQQIKGELLIIVIVDIVQHACYDRTGLICKLIMPGGTGGLPVQLHQKQQETAKARQIGTVAAGVEFNRKSIHQLSHILALRRRKTQKVGVAGNGGVEAACQQGAGGVELLNKILINPQDKAFIGPLIRCDAGLMQLHRADEQNVTRKQVIVPALDDVIDIPVQK